MEGAWIEPDLDAWSADLGTAIADMIGNHVECRGVWFDRDMSPRIDFLVVRSSTGVAVAWEVRVGWSIAWGGGAIVRS